MIQFLKGVPRIGRLVTGSEKLWAFLLAIVLVVFAYAVGLSSVPPTQTVSLLGILVVPLAVYNIGRLAMAVYDDIAQKPNSLTA